MKKKVSEEALADHKLLKIVSEEEVSEEEVSEEEVPPRATLPFGRNNSFWVSGSSQTATGIVHRRGRDRRGGGGAPQEESTGARRGGGTRPSDAALNRTNRQRLDALSRRYPGKLELRAPNGATPIHLRMQAQAASRLDHIEARVTFTAAGATGSRLVSMGPGQNLGPRGLH